MYFNNYEDSLERGLQHVGGERIKLRHSTIELLNKGEGSRNGCLRNMISNAEAIGLIQYFRDHNLAAM